MILGDCLDVMRNLSEESAGMVFMDLPYGNFTRCKWDTCIDLESLWRNLKYVGSRDAKIVATAVHPFDRKLMRKEEKLLSYKLVWDKGSSGSFHLAKFRPLRIHEDILVFSFTNNGTYNPQMELRDKPRIRKLSDLNKTSASGGTGKLNQRLSGKIYTHRFPVSILRFPPRKGDRGSHPTQKPVGLLDWLIRTYSNPGDNVLDPVAGSFTTCLSACLNGRSSVGIEKEPEYFEAGVERVKKIVRDNNLDVNIEVRR